MSDSIPVSCGTCQPALTVPAETKPDDAMVCPTCGTTGKREPLGAAAQPRARSRARARQRPDGVWGATIGVF